MHPATPTVLRRADLRAATTVGVATPSTGTSTTPPPPPKATPHTQESIPYLNEDHHPSPTSDKSSGKSITTIVVLGASGDLAQKKVFPALFALYFDGRLPGDFHVVGYARTKMDDEEFHTLLKSKLPCRVQADGEEACLPLVMDEFLSHVSYVSGQYDVDDDFGKLNDHIAARETGFVKGNRLFFLSLPPSVFLAATEGVAQRAKARGRGWTRVIVEKPFGRDLESYMALDRGMKAVLDESQIFRIDHYLGKELVENLSVLRFSNLIFEPLWDRKYIRNVQITFTEDFGTDGRGGYYDKYGVIRDIIQNHLLQVMALFAMEPPVSLKAEDVRNEKVKVLRSIVPIKREDVVVGQYKGVVRDGTKGYLDDPTVPTDSVTPTFAAMALFVRTDSSRAYRKRDGPSRRGG